MSAVVRGREPTPLPLQDRYSFVLDRVAGRRVMSVGLGGQVDETAYSYDLRRRELQGTFSAAVAAAAAHTTFVDVVPEALDAYRSVIDAEYWLVDITAAPDGWPAGFRDERFDVIVLGEVLEHLPNPGAALVNLQEVLAPGGSFLITVPNAFDLSRFGRLAFGNERVHPEHVAYYSTSTLQRLLRECGLEATEVGTYRTRRLALRQLRSNPFGYLAGFVAERLPQYGKGVVASAVIAGR